MIDLKALCKRLGVTQIELAKALGCSQANISNYRNGQSMPHRRAEVLIEFAATRGVQLDFNHIYGQCPLPRWVAVDSEDGPSVTSAPAEGSAAETTHA